MVDVICLFEDKSFSQLLPLVYFRPTYDLRCGILTLREKFQYYFPKSKFILNCRNYLQEFVSESNPKTIVNQMNYDSVLFINGRVIAESKLAKQLKINEDTLFTHKGQIVAAKLSKGNLLSFKDKMHDFLDLTDLNHLPAKEIDVSVINYPWDLVSNNGAQIVSDFNLLTGTLKGKKLRGKVYPGVSLLNKKQIFIDSGTTVKPGVVLDAEGGPIYIGKDVKIFPNAVIEGPAFIGDKSAIKIGAKIYENTSIGEVCKVGGEVEGTIIHSYSNKQHDGFLGHSYLGMWVNLGADTNNSDLKNNYGNVKVIIDGNQIDSGSMFVGLTMGDHSKSAINTMFNTGTVVGVSSNVFGSGFPPKYISSFSWGGSDIISTYELQKALSVAKRVMARRKVTLTEAEEKIFHKVFELTKSERERFNTNK
ncbi:MAG: GlmU family protein [Ignavibacteriaceae bacterium]|nr:GlmU family protein [Ignavibacteriaceae bacterium]